MKLKFYILATIFIFSVNIIFAQKGYETVTILTDAHCNSCKEKIEVNLVYTKGIKDANLDLTTKIVTVLYKPQKISTDEILKVISDLGYNVEIYQGQPVEIKKHDDNCTDH